MFPGGLPFPKSTTPRPVSLLACFRLKVKVIIFAASVTGTSNRSEMLSHHRKQQLVVGLVQGVLQPVKSCESKHLLIRSASKKWA